MEKKYWYLEMKKAQTYSAGEGTVESSRSQTELPPARQTVTAAESLTPETKVRRGGRRAVGPGSCSLWSPAIRDGGRGVEYVSS